MDPLPHPESAARSESLTRSSQPSEKVLVFDAMRALRREGHPERAAKLLDEYLRRYPSGSLAEEALALSIEASTALGDSKAKSLADRYLAHYPAGRFRAAAERARARFAQ
jgi:outer membrane protein assembly factor BamD (BamD/ComL family)